MLDHDFDPAPWLLAIIFVALAVGAGFFLGSVVEPFL